MMPTLLAVAWLLIGPRVRLAGATATGTAATGWLLDRLGVPNPVARIADSAGTHTTAMLAST
jgi:hypothetical protein